MATLTGEQIKATYDGLLKLEDSQALTGSTKVVSDGLGNNSVLGLSTVAVEVNGDTTLNGDVEVNGNLGIGTASPSYKLEVDGTFLASGNSTIQGRTNLQKDLTIRGNDALANQGVARFYVDNLNNLYIDPANDGANLFTIKGTNGNVGIGTTSPSYSLHVDSGDVETIAYFKSSDNRGRISIADNDTTSYIISEGSKMSLGTVASLNTSNLTIDSSGKVGIGTISPSYALDIVGSLNNIAKLTSSTTKSQLLFVDSDSTDTVAIGSQGDDFNVRVDNGDINLKTGSGATATTRVKINSSGNVGIGTTSPSVTLDVASDNPKIRLTDTDGGIAAIEGNLGNLILIADNGNTEADSRVAFKVDGSEKMRIDSSGNVGIGTTSPSEKLDVSGNINLSGDNRHIYFGGNNTFIGERSNSTELELRGGGSSASQTVYIDNTGQIGVGTSNPSEKLEVSGDIAIRDAIGALNFIYSNTPTRIARIDSDNGNLRIKADINSSQGNSFISFDIDASEKMRIQNSGNVGIGTTSPSEKLEVVGDAKMTGKLNVGTTTDYADNAAALLAGLVVGDIYRTGDTLKIVH